MARKSKRIADITQIPSTNKPIYNVAIYVRLSNEEKEGKGDCGSLEYQKEIAMSYIKDKPDMVVYDIYSDDGETGTNFDRDAFQRMMFDIYNGKVNCIIVKDLSRFAREYIEAGDYVEKIFPLLGVRFIAVNDKVDNMVTPMDISVPIKNVINALYAKDISKKIASSFRLKQINGEFIGGNAPYGYIKSPEDGHKFLIDTEAAEVVRQIFDMKLNGMGITAICRRLVDLKISPPSKYLFEKGLSKTDKFANNIFWNPQTVKKILTSETYLGHMVQGKTRRSLYNGTPFTLMKKDKWIVVKDTHEPIISEDIFNAVQETFNLQQRDYAQIKRRKQASKNSNMFVGKVVCGDCGSRLLRARTPLKNRVEYSFICKRHSEYPNMCSFMSLKESMLKEFIYESIRVQMSSIVALETALKNAVNSPKVKQKTFELTRQISDSLANVAYLKESRVRLTKDLSTGLLDEEEYKLMRAHFEVEMQKELEKLDMLENERSKLTKVFSADKWTAELKKFYTAKKLNKELLDAFVKQIKVYSDKRIEIEWKYSETFAEYYSILKGDERLAG